MSKSITPTGWSVPWKYKGRRGGGWGVFAATVFSITGVLGLPFALVGIFFGLSGATYGFFGLMDMASGLETIPMGLGLLGVVGWGLRLLWGNIGYMNGHWRSEKPLWARRHWASTALFHTLLALVSAAWIFSEGGFGSGAIPMVYAMLAILAFMARLSERKSMSTLDGEVVTASKGHVTLPSREEADAKVTAKAAVDIR